MRTRISVLFMVFMIMFSILLSGCWNRRDPELLSIILAVAFDYDHERELFHVIAQVANPVAMDPGEGGGASGVEQAFWVISAYGKTPFEATRTMAEGSSRELFWGHNRVVLLSEELARRGLTEVFDMLERERQFRLIARPAVVEGDIRKLMEAEFPLEETGSKGLNRQMVTIQLEKSIFHNKFMNELYSAFEIEGQEMFIGKIEVLADEEADGENEEDGSEDENGGVGTAPPAKMGGGALFREDRMVGWATPHQTEGWLYAHGRGHRFQLSFECSVHEGNYISIEVFEVSSQMRPVGSGSDVRIKIELAAKGRIQNMHLQHNLDTESEFTRSLRSRAAQVVRARIKDMIKRSQDLETDVLGFGNLIYRKEPKLWEEIADEWDKIYPDLSVDIEVELNLSRTGLVTDPVMEQ